MNPASCRRALLCILTLLFLAPTACDSPSNYNVKEQAFAWLDDVRDERSSQIREHFQSVSSSAQNIIEDQDMVDYFRLLHRNTPEAALELTISSDLSYAIDSHFIQRYGNFYDILFVNRNGLVFYSIKHESDYLTNLFTGQLSTTRLATSMQEHPDETRIDFEVYPPSGEPAAFFVVPVADDGQSSGWFVLQYASNTLNSLLTDRTNLGRTGEVYLVNSEHEMLSDSRFVNDNTVLGLVVDHEAVDRAFAEGKGHTITEDYRGVRVFSSFSTFEYFNTTWALLAEINEDEVLTQYYQDNSTDLLPILRDLAQQSHWPAPLTKVDRSTTGHSRRVDVSELQRIDGGGELFSLGVGPCTAVIAYYPDRFGYMAHIAPTDDVYIDDALSGMFLGKQKTRFLGELTRRITQYDIRLYELHRTRFAVVATHANSVGRIIDQLLDVGIELSQIHFLHNPNASYANVTLQQGHGTVSVQWVYRDKSSIKWEVPMEDNSQDLSSMLKLHLGYDVLKN